MYDVIIIGMGPAGMSAAIYAKRSNLKTLIIEKNIPGGVVAQTKQVENYLGAGKTTGIELATNMFNHIRELDIEYKIEEIIDIEKKDNFTIKTNKNEYNTKTIILSTGKPKNYKFIDGEKNLYGKGVSYCAICDAPLYKDKDVIIYGNTNKAIEEAIYMSDICSKVYLIYTKELNKKIDNVIIKDNTEITKINGINSLDNILTNKNNTINADAIFISTENASKSHIIEKLNIKTDKNFINVNNNYETNIQGLYAVGDIIKKDLYQIINAASEGAQASINIKKYLTKNK